MLRLPLVLILCATAVCGQPIQREFRFVHIQEPKSIMEAATLIRSVGEIQDVKIDTESRAMTLSGAQWQMDLATWLYEKFDRATTDQHPSIQRYEIRGEPYPAVGILHPERAQTIESIQELSVVIRSVIEIRRAFTFNSAKALVVRGTQNEITAAEWLFSELDQRRTAHATSEPWFLSDTEEGVMRVFYLEPSLSLQAFMENAVSLRREAKIRRLFTYNGLRAIALRGTADQTTVAERLLRERKVLVGM